jgi:hypothetical protein
MSAKQQNKKGAGKSTKASSAGKKGRLGPGELDKLVLAYMRKHKKDAPHTPSVIAKGIERSSGAVANCLARLDGRKEVRLVKPKPREYELVETKKKR